MSETNPPAGAKPAARAHKLRFQGIANAVVRNLLRTPLGRSAIGKRLMVVQVVGRRSGRRFEVPVAYTRSGDGRLLIGSPFGWIRNLQTGERVDIRLAGRRRVADVEVLSDEAGVVEHLGLMANDNHQFARFNRIGFDPSGNVRREDLQDAWRAGTRVALLTPR